MFRYYYYYCYYYYYQTQSSVYCHETLRSSWRNVTNPHGHTKFILSKYSRHSHLKQYSEFQLDQQLEKRNLAETQYSNHLKLRPFARLQGGRKPLKRMSGCFVFFFFRREVISYKRNIAQCLHLLVGQGISTKRVGIKQTVTAGLKCR